MQDEANKMQPSCQCVVFNLFKKIFFFADIINAPAKYASAFRHQHSVRLVDAHITNSLDDTMSCNYLPTCSRATNLRNSRSAKLLRKYAGVLPELENLSYANRTKKHLDMFLFDCHVLYGGDNEDDVLLVEATDV